MSVRTGKFSLDDGIIFDGYTGGDTWNGFATPVFTLEQAHKVLTQEIGTRIAPAVFADAIKASPDDSAWTYDPATDEFKRYDPSWVDEEYDGIITIKGEDYKTEAGQTIRLYDVTSGYCWDEEEEQLKKMLVLVTFKPSKNPGYDIPFPEDKKEPITEIRREIRVMSLTEYESAIQFLPEYAGRRMAKYTIKVLADDLSPALIEMIHKSSGAFL